MGAENLHVRNFYDGNPNLLPANLCGAGSGKGFAVFGAAAKGHFADSAGLILPLFLQDKVFAVFLAEPIADITAALSTGTMFLLRFGKILKHREEVLSAQK